MTRPWSRLTAGLVAAVLVLAVGAVSLWTTRQTAVAERAVQHSETVLDTLDHVLSRFRDAEARQRGYLLSGDTSYLGSYHTTTRVINQDLAAIARLSTDQTVRQQIPLLQSLVSRRLDEMNQSIAVRASGNMARVVAMVRTNDGKRTMDAIREAINGMEARERALLALRAHHEHESVKAAVIIIAFGSAGAFLLAVAAHLYVRRAMTEQLEAEETQRFLAAASAELGSSLAYEATLPRVAEMAVPVLADGCAVDLLGPNGALHRAALTYAGASAARQAQRLREHYPSTAEAPQGLARVLRTRQPALLSDSPDVVLAELARDPDQLELLRSLGVTSAVIAPLVAREELFGAVTLVAVGARRFAARDLEMATDIARRIAVAIDTARLFRDVEESRSQLEQQAAELEAQAEELEHAASVTATVNAELQRTNRELGLRTEAAEMASARAVVANRAKSDFLAVMSHELRTPLQAIIGFTDLVADGIAGPVTSEQRGQLGRVQTSAQHLLALIDEILTFSRVDAGKEPVHVERLDLCALAREAVAMVEPTAHSKGLTVRAHVPVVPCLIESDPTKVRQMMLNLLSNALKFTSEGEVVLSLRLEQDTVVIEVRDTGIGIAPEHLQHVFDPFWQVEQTRAKRIGGTGLGLSVTRKLAALLGGDITVKSEPNRGSVFTIWLPIAAPAVAAPDAPRSETTVESRDAKLR
ncbi:MAG TPA: ATP-binding protein [Gemmatimonadaceae bacterium]|nr:ATP-binding protein [Gemmatimonadaceae bacterium]